jgi:PAS domain S-box-containing protein
MSQTVNPIYTPPGDPAAASVVEWMSSGSPGTKAPSRRGGSSSADRRALEILLAHSSDLVVRANTRGVVTYVSPACRIWGYEPEELIGRHGAELVHPDDLTRLAANVREACAGGPIDRSVDREIRFRRKDGEWVWLEGNPQALRNDAGEVVELINVLRDVTERRRRRELESERMGFERLARQVAGVGYWRLDARTRKISWSEQMFQIYGLETSDEPPLAAALAMFHPDEQHAVQMRLQRALKYGETWDGLQSRIVRPDGEIRYGEGRAICERDNTGAVTAVFGILVDITDRKRAERAAEAAEAERRLKEELFENAFQHAAVGMALVAPDGRFLKINPAFCRLVGYPEHEMLRLDFQTITHPDDLDADLGLLQKLTAGEIPNYRMDKRYIRPDGSIVWVNLSASMVAEPDGRPRHFIAQVQDLTARKEAETALAQSEQRYRRLAVNAPDIITESRLDGVLTYVSPASVAVTGFSPEELVGRSSFSLMHPEDAPKVVEMCERVFASKGALRPWPVEFRFRHKSGHEIWLECKPTLSVDPETGRFTGLNDVIRDISARKALEADLRRAQIEAEEAAAVKSEFLANMSHELRTPLTSIVGFTQLASEQKSLSGLARKYVDRVGEASRALLCTVNDILDFSKLESGQVHIQRQPVRFAPLCQSTLDLFLPQAGAKDLSLVLDCDPRIKDLAISADSDRLRQILLNLVGNAIKFTDAGQVTLRLRYDFPAEQMSVDVIDTGPGIPPEKQAVLFQRFSQVDGSLTRAHGGTGLGLAICKGLVEAMGGTIGVESRPGHGSRFHFTFAAPPRAVPADKEDPGPGKPVTSFEGTRVLVVDDNAANRELARLFLDGMGVEVSEAADGEAAVELASLWPYDVILMDLHMPRLDGPSAARTIRETEGPNDATPILAFTADADIDTSADHHALFQGLVAKPLEAAKLIAAVARAIAPAPDGDSWPELQRQAR